MADKFWVRCGLLVCSACCSPRRCPRMRNRLRRLGQSLAISGKVTVAPSLAGKGIRNGHIVCVCTRDEWSTDARGDRAGDEERFTLHIQAR